VGACLPVGRGRGGGEMGFQCINRRPMGLTFKIHFRKGESIEQGRSLKEYIFQTYMKRVPATADNNGQKKGIQILCISLGDEH
jgi:hypothetical protein